MRSIRHPREKKRRSLAGDHYAKSDWRLPLTQGLALSFLLGACVTKPPRLKDDRIWQKAPDANIEGAKEKKPNKSPEPTTLAVTPPANAGIAPARVASHL